jgi:hypothetical protein
MNRNNSTNIPLMAKRLLVSRRFEGDMESCCITMHTPLVRAFQVDYEVVPVGKQLHVGVYPGLGARVVLLE